MNVKLLNFTPIEVAIRAIRRCYNSEHNSDNFGIKDVKLIRRIVKDGHTSTVEHIVFTFDIDGISRSCLQELVRHRIASFSVKSTRYTLKELGSANINYTDFLVDTGNDVVNFINICTLREISEHIGTIPNDILKLSLPEAYKTSLIMTINARSFSNFLKLRTSQRAHWEIRKLAKAMFDVLPCEYHIFFEVSSEK